MTERDSIGLAGQAVAANVERLRRARGLSFRNLSALLGEVGHPMLPSVLHRLAQGERRTDADDLAAIAAVFGVTPADLLAPAIADRPAVRAAHALAARVTDLVAADSPAARGHVGRAMRRLVLELDELLAEATAQADKERSQ